MRGFFALLKERQLLQAFTFSSIKDGPATERKGLRWEELYRHYSVMQAGVECCHMFLQCIFSSLLTWHLAKWLLNRNSSSLATDSHSTNPVRRHLLADACPTNPVAPASTMPVYQHSWTKRSCQVLRDVRNHRSPDLSSRRFYGRGKSVFTVLLVGHLVASLSVLLSCPVMIHSSCQVLNSSTVAKGFTQSGFARVGLGAPSCHSATSGQSSARQAARLLNEDLCTSLPNLMGAAQVRNNFWLSGDFLHICFINVAHLNAGSMYMACRPSAMHQCPHLSVIASSSRAPCATPRHAERD